MHKVDEVLDYIRKTHTQNQLNKYLGNNPLPPIRLQEYDNTFRNILKLVVLVDQWQEMHVDKLDPNSNAPDHNARVTMQQKAKNEYWQHAIIGNALELDSLYDYLRRTRKEVN